MSNKIVSKQRRHRKDRPSEGMRLAWDAYAERAAVDAMLRRETRRLWRAEKRMDEALAEVAE